MGPSVWLLMITVMCVEWVAAAKTAIPGVVRLSVIGPMQGTSNYEPLGAILPSVDLAGQAVIQPNGPLPGWKIQIVYRNSNCSSTDGPLAAIEIQEKSGECDFFCIVIFRLQFSNILWLKYIYFCYYYYCYCFAQY